MAQFMRFGAKCGLNMDALAEWEYSEKSTAPAARSRTAAPRTPASTPEAGVVEAGAVEEGGGAMMPVLKLTFTSGHVTEVEGEYATVLHRYFRSVGSSLT